MRRLRTSWVSRTRCTFVMRSRSIGIKARRVLRPDGGGGRAGGKEQRAKSKEQRAKSKEQRAKSKEQRAKSKEQRALCSYRLALRPSQPAIRPILSGRTTALWRTLVPMKLYFAIVCVLSVLFFSACRKAESPAVALSLAKPPSPSTSPSASPTRPRPSGPIEYTDVTNQAGIHFKHNSGAFGKKYLPETLGTGCVFFDYDNDGWQDIVLVNSADWPEHKTGKSFLALYHNNQDGTFTDVTRQAGPL